MSDIITAVQILGTMVGMMTMGVIMLLIPGIIAFKILQFVFGK